MNDPKQPLPVIESDLRADRKAPLVSTWCERPGATYCLHFNSRRDGLRVNVHEWLDTGDVDVRLIKGNGWRGPVFSEFAKETLANPTVEEVAEAVARVRVASTVEG